MWIIASRKSRLAMWQAEHVQALMQNNAHTSNVKVLGLSTKGDEILDRSLSKIGGKGLFVKELELALLERKADLAVHSLKDVPMELPAKFVLATILRREDPRDAFIGKQTRNLGSLPIGAKVGTSSLRREFQLKLFRPDLKIVPLRGNLDTRIKKLDEGDFDGIVLAAAGLKRLGLESRICQLIPKDISLPAAGQGAIAIEILKNSTLNENDILGNLNHGKTFSEVMLERRVAAELGASCQIPLAVYCEFNEKMQTFNLIAKIAMPDGGKLCHSEHSGHNPDDIFERVIDNLYTQGAREVIRAVAER
jgi:hydroxymethylbilane synthase